MALGRSTPSWEAKVHLAPEKCFFDKRSGPWGVPEPPNDLPYFHALSLDDVGTVIASTRSTRIREALSMVFAAAALCLQLSASTIDASLGSTLASRSTETNDLVSSTATARSSHNEAQHDLEDVKRTDLDLAGASDSAPLKAVSLDSLGAPQFPATIRLPETNPGKPAGFSPVETHPQGAWFLLLVAQHGAASFDAYTTRYAVGHGAVEMDPLMRPFASSPSIYVVSQVTPAVLDLLTRRMMRSQNPFVHRMWWVPQSASAGVYLFCGIHNLRVANH
jgi:hypothetical protein